MPLKLRGGLLMVEVDEERKKFEDSSGIWTCRLIIMHFEPIVLVA